MLAYFDMSSRLIIFLFSSFFVACAALNPIDEETAELHLKMGSSYLENGNFPLALSSLLKSNELNPKNPITHNHLGLTYFARNRFDLSERHFKRALELNPKYTDAENNLGRLLIEVGRYSEAELHLKKAINDLTFQHPDKPLSNLALASFRQGRYQEAKTQSSQALEYQRQSCFAQTLLGRSLIELKDFRAAASTLDRAIGFCGNSQGDEAQYYSALAYYQSGDTRKAITRLEEIVQVYPNGKYRERAQTMLDTMKRTTHE